MRGGERLLDLNGVRQWVRVAGAERATVPLIVLHGGPGGNHFVFERTAGRLLEPARTVVYHEQRGCGRSEAPTDTSEYGVPLLVADLHALVEHLNVPRVDLLGYSFGGGLALEYARAYGERVRRLVLQAPVLHGPHPEIIRGQLAGFQQVARGTVAARIAEIRRGPASPEAQLEAVWGAVDSATVDRFLFQSPQHAAFNRRLWQESGLTNTGDMHRALSAQPPTDTADHLGTVHSPTLVLAGRHDRNVPLALLREMAGRLPFARLHVFGHSAHFPDIEETGAYTREVLSFLASA